MRQTIWMGMAMLLIAGLSPAHAAKGDRTVTIQRSSEILASRTLDLRFADFAQGIWARQVDRCESVARIDEGEPGDAIAIYRGLFETPGRICVVYGAEQNATRVQRAAMNCRLDRGGSALGLVTVTSRGPSKLVVQEGERPPVAYRFCRAIPPLIQPYGQ
ncbi:hypothetical protein [Roseibium sediminis]|uniref:hypothetical protein n=1 Tax=Roseibium sediminis TaxID=1775174 RepID=UPI00123DFD99|nr:hypothetical protein [Roseibium sediminis]